VPDLHDEEGVAALARELGVSRATICRDLKAIRDGYVPQRLRPVRV
jgi:predicted DNA-binding transcriptional regulator YafY